MIRIAIGGKSKALLNHLIQDPPEPIDEQWEQDDLIVFSWLIQNIEPALASNLTNFPTAKTLWNALTVTYSSGKDKLQTFDLHVKANEFKQNGVPLEELWIVMQGIWGEIDRRDPNPMTCFADIATYNKVRSENKLFQFLNALDRKYDSLKREILQWDPLPSAEAAYAAVQKETAHQSIFGNMQQGVASGLNSAGDSDGIRKNSVSNSWGTRNGGPTDTKKGKDGKAAAAVGNQATTSSGGSSGDHSKHAENQEKTVKGNHGGNCCFALIKEDEPGGISEITENPPHISNLDKKESKNSNNVGEVNMATKNEKNKDLWIFDCGASETMTFDISDMCSMSKPQKSRIHTTNGEVLQVEGGATIQISPNMKLPNCLYDIRTGKIIGRGTERQGLYYVDEVTRQECSKLDACAEKCVFVGYGVNQQGYRCYSPNKRHMYTTMNCDFLKTEYFYNTQHTGQGENEYDDTLSWIKWMPSLEGINHEAQTTSQSTSPEDSTTNNDPPNLASKVSNSQTQEHVDSPIISDSSTNCETHEHVETPDLPNHVAEEESSQVEQARYVLPLRSNRGVPPKRYSPEKEAQSSRYPMANVAAGNLSSEAKAFVTSICSEEIPTTVEQALESKNWREAMKIETDALNKNDTWEKCTLPPGKKPVGCRWVFTIKYKSDGTIERYKARLLAKGYTQTYGIDYFETFSPVAKIDTIRVVFSIAANKGNDEEEMARLKVNLFKEFEMKDLGRLKYFLGIEVLRSRQGIFICQKKYVLDLLAETGMIDCKPVDTLMMWECEPIHASTSSYPHMEAVWRIIKYLKGTPGHGVLFKKNGHLETQVYTDADWAGDKGNRRSTSGYFTLVGGNLVTWRSKKQKVVALSSAEAEFRGIARGLAEIL
ncbi:uncharacterized protein LOC143547130 [Bidens hawaiensis]|uniref:uncharacterized protein LOC143547130 n=1 Tax=Bidens hawaiensis TaxID=980011 RepID=UPI00404B2B8F